MADFTAQVREQSFTAKARPSFAAQARKQSFTTASRFTAVPIFITDEAGNILTDESGAPLLTEAGWTGTPKKSNSREQAFTARAR